MLSILDSLPANLLNLEAHQLHASLNGPTLIHLRGKNPRPLFVSVLLHGNETTGWNAIRKWLAVNAGRELPRSISLFIGNVSAAREHKRRLDGQLDYNRVWKNHDSAEGMMMYQVLEEMQALSVFASVDIHNNTGENPHYACVNKKSHDFFQLARMFSRTIVYFVRPDTVQSMAFSKLCPAVTVECGKPEQPNGVEHAYDFLDNVIRLEKLPDATLDDISLYHTMATVKVPEKASFGFDVNDRDICFNKELDKLNFTELEAGFPLASRYGKACLEAIDENGINVSERYFDCSDDKIRLRLPVMPSMLTLSEEIIRQDCLCYMMEKISLEED